MSRGRQHSGRGEGESVHPESAESVEAELDPELAELLARGNQALSQQLDPAVAAASSVGPNERLVTALCVAPRDPAWTEGLIGVVERSGLAPERKDAIVARLRWDQVVADDVARAVSAAYGADSAESRAHALAAVRTVDAEAGLRSSGLEPHRAAELVRALSLIRPWWDEEEETAAAGDYAAEVTGA